MVVGGAAVAVGVYELGAAGRDERAIIQAYVTNMRHDNYAEMWEALTPAARHRISETEFAAELSGAAQIATATAFEPVQLVAVRPREALYRFVVHTHLFGRVDRVLLIPLVGSGGGTRIGFNTSLLFPGLGRNQLLSSNTLLGRRGTLLAANGQPLARGATVVTSNTEVANAIVGSVGPIPASEAGRYAAAGYPVGAKVGTDGLQAIFQRRLAGRLGGELLAGTHVIAKAMPDHGATVRTTIDPAMEQAAINALGNNYGGITVMNPHTGAIEAAAGIAFTAVQPPGSTFKIITATAALSSGIATPSTQYPYESSVVLDGFTMQNAGGETCGGSLVNAFATSCDTTFAPLGARVGGPRLVSTARRFGFDRPTGIATALESTIPSARTIGGPLAVGASAIGQGVVQASTLEMADVGATIADGGRRPLPTMLHGARPRFTRVTSHKIAGEVQGMMEAVVSYGTGTTAQIPGVRVAGKTGTAELANTAGKKNDVKNTDAWFIGYAPVGDPKVVVAALFPNQGYGADTAAPAVRSVLEAALQGA